MTNFKFRVIALSLLLLISAAACTPSDRLSDERIAELHEEYPDLLDHVSPLLNIRFPTLEEAIQRGDTYIYAEIAGDVMYYELDLGTGIPILDEKIKGYGGSSVVTFYEYPITVIKDTEGMFQEGDKLTIAANTMFQSMHMELTEGMKIIVNINLDEEVSPHKKEGRVFFSAFGMFYEVDGGYALTAFDETVAQSDLSGLKIDKVFDALKKK